MAERVPFNKPYRSGDEVRLIEDAIVNRHHLSGDGYYTKECQRWFKAQLSGADTLLTTSCTDALEMSALLLRIEPGDEVILPSFTFVSTATAFALRGATLKFADSLPNHPNVDPESVASLISERTRAIVVMHYSGMACEMDTLLALAAKHQIPVVEDAAQAFGTTYQGKPLGTLGCMGTLSFHETKNIIAGEGGLLILNDKALTQRAEMLREKGTNRAAFFRGQVDKYRWVDIGSSFLPSDMIAAFLYGQLQASDSIQALRLRAWERYHERLLKLDHSGLVQLPKIPAGASNNGHIYYLVCRAPQERDALLAHLQAQEVQAVIHYQALHRSPYYLERAAPVALPHAERYSDCLLRLPLFCEITEQQQERVCAAVEAFYTHSLL
jgi:dTDP-4-amino-4,6-dideoxygalactose transaminase